MSNIHCGVCETPINAPPGVEVALCQKCAQHPSLVAAFKQGRATMALKEDDQHEREQ